MAISTAIHRFQAATSPSVRTSDADCVRAADASARRDRSLHGIALILVSTLFFSCSDVLIKHLSSSLPAVEIAWLRYLTFSLLVLPALLRPGAAGALRTSRPGLQILRALGMVASALLFTVALRFLPVAEATATNFVSPIFITALSIPFLGETVGWRRWTAAFAGLAGVLMVIRPGTAGFDPATLISILAAFSWAVAAIATRKIGGADRPATTLAYSAFVGFLVLTAFLPFDWVQPNWREMGLGLCVGLVSTIGHWLIVLAYRRAKASTLAPFSYAQLVWSIGLGILIFGAVPDAWTLLGATIIAGSGLYTAHREHVRARIQVNTLEKAA